MNNGIPNEEYTIRLTPNELRQIQRSELRYRKEMSQ